MLLKCREIVCKIIEVRETECYEMLPGSVRMRRHAQPLPYNT